MAAPSRPIVIAVCGSPGAGKTTVARACAEHMGVPLLARDDIKAGLGWSSATPAGDGSVAFASEYHVAGGPLSRRAERILTDTAASLAQSGASVVVETSVLSGDLIEALHGVGAQVLAVHVVASDAIVERRLELRRIDGDPVAEQLAAQHRNGQMDPDIFEPPTIVDAVLKIDTSAGGPPDPAPVVAALAKLRTGWAARGMGQ